MISQHVKMFAKYWIILYKKFVEHHVIKLILLNKLNYWIIHMDCFIITIRF